MSITQVAWRTPEAKLGTCLVVVILLFALPVWTACWQLFATPFAKRTDAGSTLAFVGVLLGTPFTALVLFIGAVGLLGSIPREHKFAIVTIVLLTIACWLAVKLVL